MIPFGLVGAAFAMEGAIPDPTHATMSVLPDNSEPYSTGWGVILDNDAGISSSSDRDYTAGVAVTLGGSRTAEYRFSLDPILSRLNRFANVDRQFPQTSTKHLMQIGLMLFTPELDYTGTPRAGDRPFANLLFIENSQFGIDAGGKRAYQSTLAVGILGTNIGEAIQNGVHRLGNFSNTGEYGNQISDGGELTARYAVSRQSLLLSRSTTRGNDIQLKYSVEGDIGFLTEGSATLAARWGRFERPWWTFAPSRSKYLPQATPGSKDRFRPSSSGDFYLWGAITVRARAYNAFLQGQFRDSDVTFSGSQLNHVLGEVSIGVSRRFGNAVEVGLAAHYQTNEIKRGAGARNVRWGGLSIYRYF